MPEQKTERQLLEEISNKMNTLIGSVAIAGRELNEQIKILKALNFDWTDIGMHVGLTADAARMRFNSLRNEIKSKDKDRVKKGSKGAK